MLIIQVFIEHPLAMACDQHAKMIVTDEPTDRRLLVSFPSWKTDNVFDPNVKNMPPGLIYSLTEIDKRSSCSISHVKTTLYSNQIFDDVVVKYHENYSKYKYSKFRKNCSNAVNDVLNNLFPDAREERQLSTVLQTLCCLPTVLSATVLGCFPAPPCIQSPTSVLWKSKILMFSYGDPPKNESEIESTRYAFH